MDDAKQQKKPNGMSELPDGIKALIELPAEHGQQPILLPAATPNSPKPVSQRPDRPKTQKEQELDTLISKRQSIIGALKAKNPLVLESRRKIAEIIPSIRGKGAPQAIRLMGEAEKIEFSIATEAYTPKKEKDLIKRLREIKIELSKHKELEGAQKKVEAARSELHSAMSEIRSLEHELAECRKACEAKYNEVLAERKSAYESRQKRRDERAQKSEQFARQEQQRREQSQRQRFEESKQLARNDRKKEYEDDMSKYMKDYDDTVSLEEIVKIEKKEKKKEE